ncbi:FAD-dependent oxidoreductase [Streptosporangium subroseum]|uniref:FAD-dependent oxidoreductase n=1 Tax=Streptosporangium subroseum TaxID=106412 RepID=UPI00342415C2
MSGSPSATARAVDVLVIGGGQAGLAAGYHLRRAKIDFAILDAQTQPGGAWRHAWPSLRLFSPAQYSSLPGRMMPSPPAGGDGKSVVIVGGANSAAQILAEISTVASTTWVTQRPPRLLPDEVDGRALFDLATRRHHALQAGQSATSIGDLGDIVAVPPVRDARDRGALKAQPMFSRVTAAGVTWRDGTTVACDAIVWCTGFRPALGHLAPLRLRASDGLIPTDGTRTLGEPRLHLLGYGDWTGPASATLIGAGRTAKDTVAEVIRQLHVSGAASGT